MALTISWLTKIDGFDLDDPQKNVNASDMNEIKTVVNTNAATMDTNAANTVTLTSVKENIIPTGTINGSNTAFVLPDTPLAGTLKLYVDTGRMIGGGVDYTLSGPNITMGIAPVSSIIADYRI